MRQYSVIWCVLLTLVIGVGCSGGQVSANEKSSSSAIDVIVAPASATLSSLETVQFTALVENTPHVSVNWAASGGTISSAGLYQAPEVSSDTAVSVTATSVSDPTKSEVASLTITPKSSDPTQTPVSNPAAGKTTIKQSFFGADFNGSEVWPPTDGQHQVATLGALRLWDDGVKWGQINTASGVYNWSKLDNWIAKAQAQHIDVLYTFGDTPKFAGEHSAEEPL